MLTPNGCNGSFLQSQSCCFLIFDAQGIFQPPPEAQLPHRSCFSEGGWLVQPPAALSDLLPCNRVKVPGTGGPAGGCPASPQMAGRSEQAVRTVPLAACTDSHSPCRRLLLCVLTARKAQLPLGVRADRLIIATRVVAVRRCSLARGLQVPATLDDVLFYLGAPPRCGRGRGAN